MTAEVHAPHSTLRGRSCVTTHIGVCSSPHRRLPIAMRDSVVRVIDRVDREVVCTVLLREL